MVLLHTIAALVDSIYLWASATTPPRGGAARAAGVWLPSEARLLLRVLWHRAGPAAGGAGGGAAMGGAVRGRGDGVAGRGGVARRPACHCVLAAAELLTLPAAADSATAAD